MEPTTDREYEVVQRLARIEAQMCWLEHLHGSLSKTTESLAKVSTKLDLLAAKVDKVETRKWQFAVGIFIAGISFFLNVAATFAKLSI